MSAWCVAFCIRHRVLVIATAIVTAMLAEAARRRLPQDALPELADPRIAVVVDWMGHSAREVASAVTAPLSTALDDVPGALAVRGISMSGMGFVDVVVGSVAELDTARHEIDVRVARLRDQLPTTARVRVGPPASSTGWVFQYVLITPPAPYALVALRRFHEEALRPALAAVPGVAEVATVGEGNEQILVDVQPARLAAAGLVFTDLVAPLRSVVAGEHRPTLTDIGRLRIAPGRAESPTLADVAKVRTAPDMPIGIADYGGTRPAVSGIVIARPESDVSRLIADVRNVLDRERQRLPAGARLLPVYDRSVLSERVEYTLIRALAEEIAVVVAVVCIFLVDVRSALVPLLTLPLVALMTFAAMWLLALPATVMSLGGIAIALGMAVDADVVALEACARRLEGPTARAPDRRAQLIAAAAAFTPAIVTALMIAALTFLPVFAFTGETGRLLRPLAAAKTFVIAGAALVALTVAPVLRDSLLSQRTVREFANPITRTLVRVYAPFVQFALERPALTLITAALAVLSCVPLLPRLGGEFLPRLDEGDLLFMPTTLPGVDPGDAAAVLAQQDRILSRVPEVASVLGKVGRADTATDPAPFSMIETTIRLKPKSEWPDRRRPRWYSDWAPAPLRAALRLLWPDAGPVTTAELVERLDAEMRRVGWRNAWTAPARARMDMTSTGVRTPVGVRIVSADLERLDALGAAVRGVVARVPGTRSAVYEALGGQSWLRLEPDSAAQARVGADAAAVETAADLVVSGGELGTVTSAGRLMRVRLAVDSPLRPADRLARTTIRAGRDGDESPVPLGLVGRPVFVTEPAVVRSERAESVAYVYVDLLAGTDVLGYVGRARRAVEAAARTGELQLAADERIEWTGQYALLAAGQRRLVVIVPLVALSMLGLLWAQFRSLTEAVIVLTAVPFALVGSVWTLYLFDFPLSAPVWVGLLSAVGLAMQTGVVMVVYIDEAFHRRVRQGLLRTRADIVAAHADGSIRRLRPKIMTVTTMAAGLLPLVWADGAGAEIMRRVAAPMLGGLVTSAFLTLEVLPVLYTVWRSRQLRTADRRGVPIADVVGRVPSWARG